jgi:hypothetical protein
MLFAHKSSYILSALAKKTLAKIDPFITICPVF